MAALAALALGKVNKATGAMATRAPPEAAKSVTRKVEEARAETTKTVAMDAGAKAGTRAMARKILMAMLVAVATAAETAVAGRERMCKAVA